MRLTKHFTHRQNVHCHQMNRAEYHLLYVLSEPPAPVAKTTSHVWKTGDVFLVLNGAASSGNRFLILDVNHNGQFMALQLSDTTKPEEPSAKYLSLGPDGLALSEPGFALGIALL